MIEYELVEKRENGSCYVKFYFDDGSSVGQEIQNAPLHDEAAFELCVAEHLERIELERGQPKGIQTSKVDSLIGSRRLAKSPIILLQSRIRS